MHNVIWSKTACDSVDIIVIGDFNLDYKKKYDVNYCNANLFEIFDGRLEDLNLIQLVKFDTWSRIVGLECRSSVLDHIYVNCVSLVQNVSHSKPIFGDHELVTAELCIIKPVTKVSVRRDWRHYSKEKLNDRLGVVDWSNNAHDVQELWNDFEVKIDRRGLFWYPVTYCINCE